MKDLIGWISALILLLTLGRQVMLQWRDHTSRGLSAWLFAGQLTASLGFVIYSVMTRNIVFIVTNSLIAAVALAGQLIYLHNSRRS